MRRLVVIAGHRRVLATNAEDWRRVERHTALDALPARALRFAWPRPGGRDSGAPGGPAAWEGLVGDEAVA